MVTAVKAKNSMRIKWGDRGKGRSDAADMIMWTGSYAVV
jgi:hypothetical protein